MAHADFHLQCASGTCPSFPSSAQVNIRLKKEAIREASAVLGVNYVPPSRPTTTSVANAFRGRRWRLGGNASRISRGSTCRINLASMIGAGFVRYPSTSARRRRQRCRHLPSSRVERDGRVTQADSSVAGDPDDPESKGAAKTLGDIARRKEAIKARTRLCGRFTTTNLPAWASCDNSSDDPGRERNEVASGLGRRANVGGAMQRSSVRCGDDNVAVKRPDTSPLSSETRAMPPGPTGPEEITSCDEHEMRFSTLQQENSPSVGTSISAATTAFTAVVPSPVSYDQGDLLDGDQASNGRGDNSSNSSLATNRGTPHDWEDAEYRWATSSAVEETQAPEPAKGNEAGQQVTRTARRPTNPVNRSGRRPRGNNNALDRRACSGTTEAAGAKTTVSEPSAYARRCPMHAAPRGGRGAR